MTRFTYDVAVRWSDMDAYGHVNNARFLTLYEEARVAMFFVGARAQGLTSFEDGIVISRHEIDYLRPVDFGEDVRIELWISELRAASFTVASAASNLPANCIAFAVISSHCASSILDLATAASRSSRRARNAWSVSARSSSSSL